MRIYSDPGLSIEDQISLFVSRKLVITELDVFRAFLSNVSFQRLKIYASSLAKNPNTYEFTGEATDKELISIYQFDQGLQKLLFEIISQIEIAVKTKLVNKLAVVHGPFWFMNQSLFENRIEKIAVNFIHADGHEELRTIEVPFISHLRNKITSNCSVDSEELHVRKYYSQWDSPEIPPAWIVFEELTFGTISKTYSALKTAEIKKEIAREFGMVDALFEEMLKSMVYVRNLCAHHKFIWRRSLTIRPTLPRRKSNIVLHNVDAVDVRKIYVFLSLLIHICIQSGTVPDIRNRLLNFLSQTTKERLKEMGFPENWNDEQIWKN